MKKTIRYGKSSEALLNLKSSFFNENDRHVKKQTDIASIYLNQDLRKSCKNCDSSLNISSDSDFVKSKIKYFICDTCSHLNGAHEDSIEFCKELYTEDDGKKYSENYDSKSVDNYNYRTSSIYLPKAEFLYSTLLSNGLNPNQLKYLDFGSGAGYFVNALKKIGLKNVKGTEVSKTQVDLGNFMIGENLLDVHQLNETNQLIRDTKHNVVSLIGVLEHVRGPRELLKEIKNNSNIEFLYISVPTFSFTVFLEMLSPDFFHRHLSSAHTHLYTEDSIKHLANEFDLEIIGEWWFGADAVDLFRHLSLNLEKEKSSRKVKNYFSDNFKPIIDSLQLQLDKKKFGSEVHVLFKKK